MEAKVEKLLLEVKQLKNTLFVQQLITILAHAQVYLIFK